MGLDNGINVCCKDSTKRPEEVCYWRKCWGIRNKILNAINADKDCYSFILTPADVVSVIDILRKFDDEEYWRENHDSIWSYEDMEETLHQQIENLMNLLDELNQPDNNILKVEFYDSY